MEKVKLEILGLSPSQSNAGSFALILAEEQGARRVPIIIGMFEAQAIAIEMEKISPNRPMTHDLFKSFAQAFDYTVEEVIISEIREGIFFAKISCTDGIRQKFIDARPSDAVAVALRFSVPIFANIRVLEEAGIDAEELDKDDEEQIEDSKPKVKSDSLSDKPLDELNKMLEETLINEEYEKAAKIRDEIDRRN